MNFFSRNHAFLATVTTDAPNQKLNNKFSEKITKKIVLYGPSDAELNELKDIYKIFKCTYE